MLCWRTSSLACFPLGWAVLLCTGEPVVEIPSWRERSGFQAQPQPKWSPNQGTRMTHFCSPFWLYFSVGCDTRNLATHWWHHFFCNKFGSYIECLTGKRAHIIDIGFLRKNSCDCVLCYSVPLPLIPSPGILLECGLISSKFDKG